MSKQRDPIQGEFFNTESITTTADAVVREAVQNSLDAAAGGVDGVRVRIYVSGDAGALPPSGAAAYFDGQFWSHAEACGADGTLKDQPCRFVVVEDFGTTGLTGDETAYDEPSSGDQNDFFYFFHAEGKSRKSSADRGRWGVGKYVFPKASNVNSFFAVTVRVNGPGSPEALLMGQAVMKNHKVEGKSWEPDGWWAVIDEAGVPVPSRDPTVIKDFRESWGVERAGEPGLTVVIPYVGADLDADQLRRSVVRDYFVAILDGTLTVDIGTSGGPDLEVTGSTLDEVMETLPIAAERDDLRKNADLVRWALGLPPADVVKIQAPTGSPSWQQPGFIPDDARQKIRAALDADQSVLIRVLVKIVRKADGEAADSSFDVLLRPEDNHRGKPLFCREGIIVSEVRSRALPGVRAVVLIHPGGLADFLGDAEGPAHTNWSEKTERFKREYKYGAALLAFVRHAPARILDIVHGADDQEDRELGAQFFSVASDTAEQDDTAERDDTGEPDDTSGPDDAGGTTPPPEPPTGNPQRIRVTKTQGGGFTVRLTKAGVGLTSVDVLVAYDRSRGNPFTKWSKEDFEASDLNVEVTGGTVTELSGNRIVAAVDDAAEFTLKVAGFDMNRDVRVSTHGRTET